MTARPYLLSILLLMVASFGCSDAANSNVDAALESAMPAAFNAAGAPTVEFRLPDMMCEEGCAVAVKDILEKQPGVQDVRVDFDAKKATVAVDEGEFSSERTLAELVDKGFDNSELAGKSSASDEGAAVEASTAEVE